eukprot:TRINITY_DN17955_c0_g1_i1.p1 TRINITY_DN17955_c0_g1~~TRINITY_DN17955_c0_g1_i1.p1  ORF type:complete len:205 (-),score=14.19 TRINITY_DN17955_c0_g1_i1:6-620(-)
MGDHWRRAVLTAYESYPTTKAEGNDNNGYEWAGKFAALEGQKSRDWVKNHNIASVHEKDYSDFKLKELIIRDPDTKKELTVTVYDKCSDKDCNGCCTKNLEKYGAGYLIDLEKYTASRFVGEKLSNVDNFQPRIIEFKISSGEHKKNEETYKTHRLTCKKCDKLCCPQCDKKKKYDCDRFYDKKWNYHEGCNNCGHHVEDHRWK